jgi:hypothetical protein
MEEKKALEREFFMDEKKLDIRYHTRIEDGWNLDGAWPNPGAAHGRLPH